MEIQNSTSAIGQYWDFLFTDLAGEFAESLVEFFEREKRLAPPNNYFSSGDDFQKGNLHKNSVRVEKFHIIR